MRRVTPLTAAILVAGVLAGVWMATRTNQELIRRAAADLPCPIDQVQLRPTDPKSSYPEVEGCGRRCVYYKSLTGEVSLQRCD